MARSQDGTFKCVSYEKGTNAWDWLASRQHARDLCPEICTRVANVTNVYLG